MRPEPSLCCGALRRAAASPCAIPAVHVYGASYREGTGLGTARPGIEVGLRFNPGLGSGGTSKTNVGGPSSSFGIWFEHADECLEIANSFKLKVPPPAPSPEYPPQLA